MGAGGVDHDVFGLGSGAYDLGEVPSLEQCAVRVEDEHLVRERVADVDPITRIDEEPVGFTNGTPSKPSHSARNTPSRSSFCTRRLNEPVHLGADVHRQLGELEELRDPGTGEPRPSRDVGPVYSFTIDCGSHGLGTVEELDDAPSPLPPLLPHAWLGEQADDEQLLPVLASAGFGEYFPSTRSVRTRGSFSP